MRTLIIFLFAVQFAYSQEAFQFPESITMTHECAEGTFVDFQLKGGNCYITFPNSHEIYILGEYDEDPVWVEDHYEGCFSGSNFHGCYVIQEKDAFIRVSLDVGCILMFGGTFIPPKCYHD